MSKLSAERWALIVPVVWDFISSLYNFKTHSVCFVTAVQAYFLRSNVYSNSDPKMNAEWPRVISISMISFFLNPRVVLSPTTGLQHNTMSSSLRKLRIIAMPLTRPNVSNRILSHINLAKPSRLVYYQFQITTPSSTRLESGDHDSTSSKKKGWLPKEGIAKWATKKVADVWAGFGKTESGWKVCSMLIWLQCDDRWVLSDISWKYIGLESGWWIVWNLKS